MRESTGIYLFRSFAKYIAGFSGKKKISIIIEYDMPPAILKESSDELQRFIRTLSLAAIMLFLLFAIPDYLLAKELFCEFLVVRLAISLASVAYFILSSRIDPSRIKYLFLAMVTSYAIAIHFMLFRINDIDSLYFLGLATVGLASSAYFLSSFAVFIFCNVIVYVPYIIWSLANCKSEIELARLSVHFFFIFGFFTISWVMRGFYIKLHLKERRLRNVLKSEITSRESIIDQQASDLSDAQLAFAVASSMQMLAHDVRKSFSIAKMGLDMIENSETLEQVRDVMSKLRPQIDQSRLNIDKMFLEVSSARSSKDSKVREEVDLEQLVQEAVDQVGFIYADREVDIRFDFLHRQVCWADKIRLQRVLMNLIVNAYEATSGKFTLWFKTKDVFEAGANKIFLEVGNSGSYVEPALLSEIFDPFITKGKKGGTGLGLAICAKVISDHGGSIECKSDKAKGTHFLVALPAT